MNYEHSEGGSSNEKADIEALQASVDTIADGYGETERNKLKNNLQHVGIRKRYREIKTRFDEGDSDRYYAILLEGLMHDMEDFPE